MDLIVHGFLRHGTVPESATSQFYRPEMALNLMKQYMCVICGFVYDEAAGIPDEGIAPGTKWEDVPENWGCPDCGAGKADFEMVEI